MVVTVMMEASLVTESLLRLRTMQKALEKQLLIKLYSQIKKNNANQGQGEHSVGHMQNFQLRYDVLKKAWPTN